MLTSGRKKSVQDALTANDHDCNGCKANRAFISQECGARRGIVRFWKVNATSRVVHRRTIFSDFIIITYFGKVNGSYTIVTIPLALSNRFFGRRILPGGNGTFNVIFRFSLLTNCVVMDYNYVRSV